jgi:hypothetical protein
MRSRLTIDIAAPPELVFAVVGDPVRWPALLPHYRRVDVVRPRSPAGPASLTEGARSGDMVARYVAVRPLLPLLGVGFPVAWTSRCQADAERLTLEFSHVGGATAGMRVTWQLEPYGAGTRVTLDHEFSRSLPIPFLSGGDRYPRLIDRWFVRPIAGRTLATFRALCESLPSAAREARTTPDRDGMQRRFDPLPGRPRSEETADAR